MAVGTQLNTFHDASGLVTCAVFQAPSTTEQEVFLHEQVDVADGDMIAIGGGGVATDGVENTLSRGGPGALLTASFPSGDFVGWIAQSRDHEFPQTYTLVSYVIGMKIAGMTRNQLIDSISIQTDISSSGNHIEKEVGIPSNEFVLIGGGFQVDPNRFNLATASFPSSEFSWKARSQDHHVANPASIRVFAISIKRQLPNGLRVVTQVRESDGGQAPHPAASAPVSPEFAMTGGGAEVIQVNNGNFLWKLQPSPTHDPSFTAASKDHGTSAPCPIRAFVLGIRLV